jgi:3-deoxy-D-manno-octulosonate 8-phosphate phosphatase (KDO 8-P phosphatase)
MIENIRLICCDIDGTLTDGMIYLGAEGELFKTFNVKDGLGVSLAQKRGIRFALITGRKSDIVNRRAEELGIDEVYQGVEDKRSVVQELIKKYRVTRDQVAYIGDDVNDVCVKSVVGWLVAVGDAHPKVKKEADIVLQSAGGKGAIREFIDLYVLPEG